MSNESMFFLKKNKKETFMYLMKNFMYLMKNLGRQFLGSLLLRCYLFQYICFAVVKIESPILLNSLNINPLPTGTGRRTRLIAGLPFWIHAYNLASCLIWGRSYGMSLKLFELDMCLFVGMYLICLVLYFIWVMWCMP